MNIMVYDEPPDPNELRETYENAIEELSSAYGRPRISQKEYSVWVPVAESYRLVRRKVFSAYALVIRR